MLGDTTSFFILNVQHVARSWCLLLQHCSIPLDLCTFGSGWGRLCCTARASSWSEPSALTNSCVVCKLLLMWFTRQVERNDTSPLLHHWQVRILSWHLFGVASLKFQPGHSLWLFQILEDSSSAFLGDWKSGLLPLTLQQSVVECAVCEEIVLVYHGLVVSPWRYVYQKHAIH